MVCAAGFWPALGVTLDCEVGMSKESSHRIATAAIAALSAAWGIPEPERWPAPGRPGAKERRAERKARKLARRANRQR